MTVFDPTATGIINRAAVNRRAGATTGTNQKSKKNIFTQKPAV
jgi:hypothetical protein